MSPADMPPAIQEVLGDEDISAAKVIEALRNHRTPTVESLVPVPMAPEEALTTEGVKRALAEARTKSGKYRIR